MFQEQTVRPVLVFGFELIGFSTGAEFGTESKEAGSPTGRDPS